jgi:hypothetical protein
MNLEHWINNWFANQRAMRLFFPRRARLGEVFFGQTARLRLVFKEPFMSLLLFARRAAICFCWGLAVGIPAAVFAQADYYTTNGAEYAIVGSLPGDQVFPDAAVTPNGGFVVWQDNTVDGSGWGISATRLDPALNADLTWSDKKVNFQVTNDQENPRVALLKNGGAVFVWQGGPSAAQQIYARFLAPTNAGYVWLTTNDMILNTPSATKVSYTYSYTTNTTSTVKKTTVRGKTTYITNITAKVTTTGVTNLPGSGTFRANPAVAALAGSNVVVVWASFNQAGPGSMLDVYGQVLTPAGQKVGGEFLINQFTAYNQRSPAVAALKNGGFVVAWVSEQQRSAFNLSGIDNTNGSSPAVVGSPSVDVYARFYNSNGVAQGTNFLVNTDNNPCSNPNVAVASDGKFMVVWAARDTSNADNGWDVYARAFSSAGVGGATVRVNSYIYGDQYAPRISAIGGDYMIVWTSLGQDGSRGGVFGQSVHEDGSLVGPELRVNTMTAGQQIQPVVTGDGAEQFLVVWAGFTFSPASMDLFAQRYANVAAVLQPMSAPFVYAPFVVNGKGVYQPQLQVSWPALPGISVSNYEVFVDGAGTPIASTTNTTWTMTAAANSTHSFQLDYVTTGGRRPLLLSPSASGTTWGGAYWGPPSMAIPFEWMQQYFGNNLSVWPAVTADSDGDGMNNYQEFQGGTIPTNSASVLVLRVQISKTTQTTQTAKTTQGLQSSQNSQGIYLSWNTQPGLTYQVQVTTNFTSWSNVGGPQFAADTSDAINLTVLGQTNAAGYYRVVLLRQ